MQVAEPLLLDSNFTKLKYVHRLALAVSGGSDSMAMLRLVAEWATTLNRPPQVFVLTVDHGLRSAAAAEAEQVAQWCAALGLAHHTLRWQHEGISTGIQAKARTARYDLMSGWCNANGIPVLLTAHTADDQAETVFMRQHRTDSPASLAGIWPEISWQGVLVQRPLLRLRRAALRNYLHELGQNWIDDPSNDDVRFERVRVRKELAGEIHDLEARATAAQDFIERAKLDCKNWCQTHITVHDTGYVTMPRGALALLTDLDFVVLRVISLCGNTARAVEREERLALQNWLRQSGTGRRTLGGVVFVKRKAVLLAGREAGRIAKQPDVIGANGNLIWDARFQLQGPVGALVIPLRDLGPVARRADIPAFVQAGLPAIMQDDKIWSIPHLGIGNDVFVRFCPH